jgi:hypothetical protein
VRRIFRPYLSERLPRGIRPKVLVTSLPKITRPIRTSEPPIPSIKRENRGITKPPLNADRTIDIIKLISLLFNETPSMHI